jgi:hypothetical protein
MKDLPLLDGEMLDNAVVNMLTTGNEPALLDGEVSDYASATRLLGRFDEERFLTGQRVPSGITCTHGWILFGESERASTRAF